MTSETAGWRLFLVLLLASGGLYSCAIGLAPRLPEAEIPGEPYREAGGFVIAPQLTSATFEVAAVDFVSVKGEFKNVSGQLQGDGGVPRQVEVTLESASADTGTDFINDLLRGPKFFNAASYPALKFSSSDFRRESQRLTAVEGSLTLLGITRNITLKVARFDCRRQEETAQCVAQASTTIKRSEFGMTAWPDAVADEVKIDIRFTAVKRG